MKDNIKIIALTIFVSCLVLISSFFVFEIRGEKLIDSSVGIKLYEGKPSENFVFSEGDYITYQNSYEAMTAIASQPIRLEFTHISENGYTVKLIDTFREGNKWEELSVHDYVFVRSGRHKINQSLFFPDVDLEFASKEDNVTIYKHENLTVWINTATGIPFRASVLVENRTSSLFGYYKNIELVGKMLT